MLRPSAASPPSAAGRQLEVARDSRLRLKGLQFSARSAAAAEGEPLGELLGDGCLEGQPELEADWLASAALLPQIKKSRLTSAAEQGIMHTLHPLNP